MRRFAIPAALSAVLLVLGTVPASAGPSSAYTCTDGVIPGGTYSSLTVTGNCVFGGDVTVTGNVSVRQGAVLNDHAGSAAEHVTIRGNVTVAPGAILGLGTYDPTAVHDTTVYGNIVANRPVSLYLSFTTVHGNVVSLGGGSTTEFRNFPIKDDVIDGSLIVSGWHGGWLGVIRDNVGGNVLVAKNASVLIETPVGCDAELGECTGSAPGVDADSTEIQTNVIQGNLACFHNTPTAQVNPMDGGQPNVVGGRAVGECAGLTS